MIKKKLIEAPTSLALVASALSKVSRLLPPDQERNCSTLLGPGDTQKAESEHPGLVQISYDTELDKRVVIR